MIIELIVSLTYLKVRLSEKLQSKEIYLITKIQA